MANFPSLDDVKAWMKLADDVDDAALTAGMKAAESHMLSQLDLPTDDFGDEVLNDDLAQAFLLRVQRYLARRNSPDGLVGFAEFGAARVLSLDPDIERLEGPYKKIVLA